MTTMRRLKLLLAAGIAAAAVVLAGSNLRLGRELIFRSADVKGFVLPNGKAVLTNTWYQRSELLDPGQEFYTGGNGLAIMVPEADTSLGFARITDEGYATRYLQVQRMEYTVLSTSPDLMPVEREAVLEVNTEGYSEWWVCRRRAEDQQ